MTTFCNWCKFCPKDLPAITLLYPPEFTGIFNFHTTTDRLTPDTSCHVHSSFCMFHKSSTSWRNRIVRSLLSCKKIKSRIVDIWCRTWFVIHHNDKHFQNFLIQLTQFRGVFAQFTKYGGNLRTYIPGLPSGLLAFTSKCWNHITAGKCMKKWESYSLLIYNKFKSYSARTKKNKNIQ